MQSNADLRQREVQNPVQSASTVGGSSKHSHQELGRRRRFAEADSRAAWTPRTSDGSIRSGQRRGDRSSGGVATEVFPTMRSTEVLTIGDPGSIGGNRERGRGTSPQDDGRSTSSQSEPVTHEPRSEVSSSARVFMRGALRVGSPGSATDAATTARPPGGDVSMEED